MALISQTDLSRDTYDGPAWHGTVLNELTQRLSKPSKFPCTFGVNAFARDLVMFSFIETLDEAGLKQSAADIGDFVDLSAKWDGKVNTASPMVMAFSAEAFSADRVEAYHDMAWKILQYWHDTDPEPWPDTIPHDPHEPFWTMCYKGMQIFINVSNPAHKLRHSRNLGNYMGFIINPRERFDVVAGNSPDGQKVRDVIRKRIDDYDDIGHCPQLSNYLWGHIEWWQYGIIEENRERTDKCPFQHKGS